MEFKLKDITQLDEISYDEVDKILQKYEDTWAIVEYRLKKFGSLHDEKTYTAYDEFMADLPQTREIRRRRAIAIQIYNFYNGEAA